MSIYIASTKSISRGQGKSAVLSAAYRAAEKLHDKRTGLNHDYTKKQGVVSADIILPNSLKREGATIDRGDLWNLAESAEKRADARVAREWLINLPHELSADDRTEIAHQFARHLANRYGVIADCCIHEPTEKEIERGADPRNHHAHIMFTTRKAELSADNKIVLTDKATIELSDTKRATMGLERVSSEVKEVRQIWEHIANEKLAERGHALIDARSYAERGIDKIPQLKLGAVATKMQRDANAKHKEDGHTGVAPAANMRVKINRIIDERNALVAGLEIAKKQAADAVKDIIIEPAPVAAAEPVRETATSRPANFTFGQGQQTRRAEPAPALEPEHIEYAPAPAPAPKPRAKVVEPEPIEYKSLRLENDSDTSRYYALMHMHDDAVKTPQNEYFGRFIGEKMTKIDFEIEQFRQGLSRNMSAATSQQQEDMQSAFIEVKKWRSNIGDYQDAYYKDKEQARAEVDATPSSAAQPIVAPQPSPERNDPTPYDRPSSPWDR